MNTYWGPSLVTPQGTPRRKTPALMDLTLWCTCACVGRDIMKSCVLCRSHLNSGISYSNHIAGPLIKYAKKAKLKGVHIVWPIHKTFNISVQVCSVCEKSLRCMVCVRCMYFPYVCYTSIKHERKHSNRDPKIHNHLLLVISRLTIY